jgi:hypothetical protein
VSAPEATTLPLPLTGAARKSTPAAVHSARIFSEDSIDTVEQSTTAPGSRCGSTSRPPSPSSTCSRSAGVDTIVNTTSLSRRSAIVSATPQPWSAIASALARVRFHTCGFTPARASRTAMAAPIRPAPIHPTERSESLMSPPFCKRLLDQCPDTPRIVSRLRLVSALDPAA